MRDLRMSNRFSSHLVQESFSSKGALHLQQLLKKWWEYSSIYDVQIEQKVRYMNNLIETRLSSLDFGAIPPGLFTENSDTGWNTVKS